MLKTRSFFRFQLNHGGTEVVEILDSKGKILCQSIKGEVGEDDCFSNVVACICCMKEIQISETVNNQIKEVLLRHAV